MERWSARWQWGERVEAWDDELDRQACRELVKGITRMRRSHVDIAQAMLTKAFRTLRRIPVSEMTLKDIATIVDVASKLERLSRSEATERTEGRQTIEGQITVRGIDLSALSDEELVSLEQLLCKSQTEPGT